MFTPAFIGIHSAISALFLWFTIIMKLQLLFLLLCVRSFLLYVNKHSSFPSPDGSEAQPYSSLESAFAAASTLGEAQVVLSPGSDLYATGQISSVAVPIVLRLNGNEIVVDREIQVTGEFAIEGPGQISGIAGFTIGGSQGSLEVRQKAIFTKMISTAVTLAGGNLAIDDCEVTSNTGYFTLITNLSSHLKVTNSRFSSNSATLFSMQSCDSISYLHTYIFQNCLFRDNGSYYNSQPIVINFSPGESSLLLARVEGCTFVNNKLTTIAVAWMGFAIADSSFSEEVASISLSNIPSTVQMRNCRFSQMISAVQIASSGDSLVSGCIFTHCTIALVVRSCLSVLLSNSQFTYNYNNLDDPLLSMGAAGFSALQVEQVTISGCLFAYNNATMSPSIIIVQATRGATIDDVTVANTTSAQMGVMALLASNTHITNSLFTNITSVDAITAYYGSQVRLDYSTVFNINGLTGSFYGSNFSEFSSAHTTYRNITCELQLIRAHVLFNPIILDYDVFDDIVASYILSNEFQGGRFLGCSFNLPRVESSNMILTTVCGQGVHFYDTTVTGYFNILLDAESTEGVIYINNLTVWNARASGLFSSLQFSITMGNSSFHNFEVKNATLNQIALA